VPTARNGCGWLNTPKGRGLDRERGRGYTSPANRRVCKTFGCDCKTSGKSTEKSATSVGNGVTVAYRVLGYPFDFAKVVLQPTPILVRLFPAISERFAKPSAGKPPGVKTASLNNALYVAGADSLTSSHFGGRLRRGSATRDQIERPLERMEAARLGSSLMTPGAADWEFFEDAANPWIWYRVLTLRKRHLGEPRHPRLALTCHRSVGHPRRSVTGPGWIGGCLGATIFNTDSRSRASDRDVGRSDQAGLPRHNQIGHAGHDSAGSVCVGPPIVDTDVSLCVGWFDRPSPSAFRPKDGVPTPRLCSFHGPTGNSIAPARDTAAAVTFVFSCG
jgi:hypothetical protein